MFKSLPILTSPVSLPKLMTRRYPVPNSQPMIPVKTYRFYFSTERPIRLPGFAGSAWRGAFGHALKKTVCVVRNTPCNQCLLKNACAYSVVFETPPPANAEKMRKYTAAPHPFVLQFPVTASASNAIPDIFADSGIELPLPGPSELRRAGERAIQTTKSMTVCNLTIPWMSSYSATANATFPTLSMPCKQPDKPVSAAITRFLACKKSMTSIEQGLGRNHLPKRRT